MRTPRNRKAYVIGYAVASPLGKTLSQTWARAVAGEAGFREVTRCRVSLSPCVVGEIPDWHPEEVAGKKDAHNWNADFVILTMYVCREALIHAGVEVGPGIAERTACLIGSSLNGSDAMRHASLALLEHGPNKVSPYLLPNLCANVPSGKASMALGFTGPIFSPQGACASANHAMGIGARMIRDGDIDFALVGGVDTAILPEILHGFANMNATVKIQPGDRAEHNPALASRPFSRDRKGFVLSEGAAALVLAADEVIQAYGLKPRAEVLGVGWTSDAYHYTKPNPVTIVRAVREALDDAGLSPTDVQYINAHGTSTPKGDLIEINCLKEVFGDALPGIPISSNKSQIGHTLGAAAGIEAALTIEGLQQQTLLPTINYLPDPAIDGVDLVPNVARPQAHEIALSNAFGFGGTNCCVILRGV